MHQVMSDLNYPGSDSNKSAKRGVCPPVWHQERWRAGSTSEAANAVAHVTPSIRVHLRSHRRPTWNRMNDGASCAFACDNSLNTSTDSSLHRPPVSMAMTMSLHRPEVANSRYAVSLSVRAFTNMAPSMSAACAWASPSQVNTLRRVTSTANCTPP